MFESYKSFMNFSSSLILWTITQFIDKNINLFTNSKQILCIKYKFIYKQQTNYIHFKTENINRNIFSESVHSLGMFRTDLQVFAMEKYLDLFSQK